MRKLFHRLTGNFAVWTKKYHSILLMVSHLFPNSCISACLSLFAAISFCYWLLPANSKAHNCSNSSTQIPSNSIGGLLWELLPYCAGYLVLTGKGRGTPYTTHFGRRGAGCALFQPWGNWYYSYKSCHNIAGRLIGNRHFCFLPACGVAAICYFHDNLLQYSSST